MLKSQMNRTLNLLEAKNIITRKRSDTDKRQVYIIFKLEDAHIYKEQHKKILALLDEIISQLGTEKTADIISALTDVANIADSIINEKATKEQ